MCSFREGLTFGVYLAKSERDLPAAIAVVFLVADGAPAAFSSPRPLARVAAQQYTLSRVYFLLLLLCQCLYVDLGRIEAESRVFAVVGQVLSSFL